MFSTNKDLKHYFKFLGDDTNMKRNEKMAFNDMVRWNSNTYGKAVRINKKVVIGLLIFLCIVTPMTNWLIPFILKGVRSGINIRYGV